MASIVFGGGITNMVGSAAGNTFARNKGGSYVKKKTHGTNPRSTSQLKFRTSVGLLSKHYSYTLTDLERAAWRTFAATNPTINRLGNTTFLSGQQAFTKFNAIMLITSSTIVATPPVSTAVGTVTSIFLAAASDPGGTVSVNIHTTGAGAFDQALLWLSPPMNPGRAFISSQLRLIGDFIPRDTLTDVTARYKAVFGSLPTDGGQRIFIRAQVVNTLNGVVSAFLGSSELWT